MKEVLVLGAEGSGKSLLIRRIGDQSKDSFHLETASESTIPTTGVEIVNVEFGQTSVNIREIGSAMSSRWDSYLEDCVGVIFIIDVLDFGSLSSAQVMLHELMTNNLTLKKRGILIVFNKLDAAEPTALRKWQNILRFENMLIEWPNMQYLCGSCVSPSSLPSDTLAWLLTV